MHQPGIIARTWSVCWRLPRLAAAWMLFALASPCWAQGAQAPAGRVLSLLEVREAVNSGDPARLTELAYSDLPAGALMSTIDLYSRAQLLAAQSLLQLDQSERIVRRWMAANPANLDAKFILLNSLIAGMGDKLEEALAVAREIEAAVQLPSQRAALGAALADLHARLGEVGRARERLEHTRKAVEAELDAWGVQGTRAFWAPMSRFTLHLAACRLELAAMRPQEADRECRQAHAHAAVAVRNRRAVPAHEQNYVATRQAEALYVHVGVQVMLDRLHDAQAQMDRADELAKAPGIYPWVQVFEGEAAWRLRTAQRDFAALRALHERFRGLLGRIGASPASLGMIQARRLVQTSWVLAGDWPAAAAAFEESDRLLGTAEPAIQLAAANVVSRALVAMATGRQTRVLTLVESELARSRADLGDRHARTALLSGLHAVLAGRQPAQRQEALRELDLALAVLDDPSSPGLDALLRAEAVPALGMIRRAYLDLLGEAASARQQERAFAIADALRGSAVQQAVHDAAVRAAAEVAGLGDLVRRDQDSRGELQSLYHFIAQESVALPEQRRDAVITRMRQRIGELERERARMGEEISRGYPDYARLLRPGLATPGRVRELLREGEVFISLVPTESAVHVWAVSRAETRYHRAALDHRALDDLVGRLRRTTDVAGLGRAMPAFDAAASSSLYRAVLEPVLRGQTPRHLVVAAGGALGRIPFAVLLREPVDAIGPDAPWLIRECAISHVASANAWMATRQRALPPGPMSLAAWADPLFDRGAATVNPPSPRTWALTRADAANARAGAIQYAKVPPLPETREEVEAIARSLGVDTARHARFGEHATRRSVLDASARGELLERKVLVFATHGLIAGDLPNLVQPALAMAATGDEARDPLAPLLTLQDVLGLKLRAEWVVLSACNTAAADGRAGEALSGLARGFFYAGARSLLVTHWAVDSEAATQLTTATFAHQAAHPGAPKAQSLRESMLRLMAHPRHAHPAYWAPYVLVGDGG